MEWNTGWQTPAFGGETCLLIRCKWNKIFPVHLHLMKKLVEAWQPTFIQSFILSQLSDTVQKHGLRSTLLRSLWRCPAKAAWEVNTSWCSEFVQTSFWPCGFLQETPKATLGKQHDPGHCLRRWGDNSKCKVLFYCSFKRARNRPDHDPLEMYILEPFREQELTLLVSFSKVDQFRADYSQAM